MANFIPYFLGNVKEKNHANPHGERVSNNPPCDKSNSTQYRIRRWTPGDQLSLDYKESYHYHDPAWHGYFSILAPQARPKESHYPVCLMPEVLRCLPQNRDTYLSQMMFRKPKRLISNISGYGLSFIDLDFYKTPTLADIKPAAMVQMVLDHATQELLPPPSAIMYSGRGLYLKWYYERRIPSEAKVRWDALQACLLDQWAGFGADPTAIDGARYLRLEHTINTRSNERVRVLWPTEDNEPRTYTFDYLCGEYFDYSRTKLHELGREKAQRDLARKEAAEARPARYRGLEAKNMQHLNWMRVEDIRKLYSPAMRGPVPEGQRDTVLYLVMSCLAWTIWPDQLRAELANIHQEFVPGLPWREAVTYAGSVLRRAAAWEKGEKRVYNGKAVDPRYKHGTDSIISKLGISSAEQRQLHVLVDPAEVKRRQREKKEAIRRSEGKVPRAEYLSDRARVHIVIEQKLALGIKPAVIAKDVGVSKRLVEQIRQKCEK